MLKNTLTFSSATKSVCPLRVSATPPMTAQGVNVARKSDKKATGSQVMNSG